MQSTTDNEIYEEVLSDWLRRVNAIVSTYEAGLKETAEAKGYRMPTAPTALPPREGADNAPTFPWPGFFDEGPPPDRDAVKKVLRGVPDKLVNAIIAALKPFPLELYVAQDHRFSLLIHAKNQLIQRYKEDAVRLGSLVSSLKIRAEARPSCPDSMRSSLEMAAQQAEYALRFANTYRDFLEHGPLVYIPSTLDSKGKPKNLQKLAYWSKVLERAMPLIEHKVNSLDYRAYKKPPTVTAAQLLKILYPTIWPESASDIARRLRDRLSK